MLEYSSLLLRPSNDQGTRPILDGDSGKSLGFTCWRPDESAWRCFRGKILEVHEEDDAPLLFTLHSRRFWPTRTDVRDADGFLVGVLVGKFILNELNRRIATCHRRSDRTSSLESPQGKIMATMEFASEGARLDFQPEVEHNPFVKMLLLAALIREMSS